MKRAMIHSKQSKVWKPILSFWFVYLFFITPCSILCHSANGQNDDAYRSMNQPVTPFRIIGNIYYVGASDVTSFLITTTEGHILLDSGYSETVPQISRNVATLGFKLEDIRILINSHAHLDHAGGLAELKQLTKARLFASRKDKALLESGGKGDFNFGDSLDYAPVKVDSTLGDGEQVKLGGTILTANITPGHTKGCTTWTMKVSDNGSVYDVVFVGSATSPGYKLVGNEKYPNIVADYEETFRKMKKLSCDVFLASHGNFFNLKKKMEQFAKNPNRNPFIDSEGYKDFLRQTEEGFRAKLKDQQKKV